LFMKMVGFFHSFLIFSLLPSLVITLSTSAITSSKMKDFFRIRTITAFIRLSSDDFNEDTEESSLSGSSNLKQKIQRCSVFLSSLQEEFVESGYTVQTLRISTNAFGEYLLDDDGGISTMENRLSQLDLALEECGISFCSLGPAKTVDEIRNCCPRIISSSPRLACSANVNANDIDASKAAAECVLSISAATVPEFLQGGMGNFRFCSATCCPGNIPFYPASYSSQEDDSFAIGLENGALAHVLLSQCGSISNISKIFSDGMTSALQPLQKICEEEEQKSSNFKFLGIDTSLNPSLDEGGSVAAAIESLEEVCGDFGGTGTLAAAAAITTALQSLPSIKTTGYCGLMLPVCEDQRLAALTNMRVTNFLSISSVCGVGIDTVPIAASTNNQNLQALMLDVAALATRWNKPLSCRVFPVGNAGEMTQFDSPYLCNSIIYPL